VEKYPPHDPLSLMKLNPEQIQTLIDVLNAQSQIKKIENPEEYKQKREAVEAFLNSTIGEDKNGKKKIFYTGGIKKEIYTANKENAALTQAAELHMKAAQERPHKKKTDNPVLAATTTPHEEIARNVVKYLEAKITWHKEGVKTLEAAESRTLKNKVARLLDSQKGGLSNEPSKTFGGASPWKTLKDFPQVAETCAAHQDALKTAPKVPFIDAETYRKQNTELTEHLQKIAADIQENLLNPLEDALPDPTPCKDSKTPLKTAPTPSPSKLQKAKGHAVTHEIPME
jgi:hypothetical protein